MDASSWMKLGQIGSSATSVLPNWYDLDNSENSKDLNEALYGDSTQNPIVRLLMGHNNAMQNELSQVNSNVTDYSDYKNNTNLENAWDPNALQSNANADFGWSNIADNLQATATGASYGAQLGGGWGALIGAGVGMLSNIGSQIGYKNRANRINTAVDRANQQTTDSFYNTAKGNQTQMMRDYFMHTPYAEGGSLEEQNGVTKFNVGGTHSQNPYDGIQQGIASDGLPNMVEEGELKYNDYIYSARLKPSKSLLKQYNLPERYAGKTFAEIGDKLQQESKDRPNDPISKTTLDEWMLRLQNAQEEYKAKAEERRLARVVNNMSDEEKAALLSSLEQPMTQQEGIDLSQPMYAEGGKLKEINPTTIHLGYNQPSLASQVLFNAYMQGPALQGGKIVGTNSEHSLDVNGNASTDYINDFTTYNNDGTVSTYYRTSDLNGHGFEKVNHDSPILKQVDNLNLQRSIKNPDYIYSPLNETIDTFAKGGKIHIKPSKRGTFTAAAKKRGMEVQEFASKVLANKENYSPAMVKKANFARNFGGHKHAEGGYLVGQTYDVSEEEYNRLIALGYEIERV